MCKILTYQCRVVTWSGKTKKNDKSQLKIGVYEKSQEEIKKKNQILSVQIYKIPFI